MSEDDKLTQEEQREVELEFTIQALYDIIGLMEKRIPFHGAFGDLPEVARQLFNNAEIRDDIENWGTLEIEFEGDK